jgi:L-alanine-DL-glutamate epimerase-like enolase superfamily enzyme
MIYAETFEVTATDVNDPGLYLKDRFTSIEKAISYAKLMLDANCGWEVNIKKLS